MSPFQSAQIPWDDGTKPNLGAGVSRPRDGESTKDYTLLVWFEKTKPMRVVMPAPSAKEARKYIANRWPQAIKVDLIK